MRVYITTYYQRKSIAERILSKQKGYEDVAPCKVAAKQLVCVLFTPEQFPRLAAAANSRADYLFVVLADIII